MEKKASNLSFSHYHGEVYAAPIISYSPQFLSYHLSSRFLLAIFALRETIRQRSLTKVMSLSALFFLRQDPHCCPRIVLRENTA